MNLLTHLYEETRLRADEPKREENRCWLVMDLARGGDLHNKILDEVNISMKRGGEPGRGFKRGKGGVSP